MAGSCKDCTLPEKGWREVGEPIYHNVTDDACECCRTTRERKYLYVLEHNNFDGRIKVGENCKDALTEKDTSSVSDGTESNNQTGNTSQTDVPTGKPPEEKPVPIPELIALAGASMILMGNLALFEDFYPSLNPSRPPPQTQRQSPAESPGNANNRNRNRLSPEVEERLRDCLKERIKSVVGVPGLSDLVESLMNEDEYSIGETQRQIRTLYRQVQQLRKTITECDPSLINELIEADEREAQANEQEQHLFCESSIIITEELINIMEYPSLHSAVIGQASYGSCLQLDTEAFAYLQEVQRQEIVDCRCWYPVILSNGIRGYVYSYYASTVHPSAFDPFDGPEAHAVEVKFEAFLFEGF